MVLSGTEKRRVFSGRSDALTVLEELELSVATRTVVETELALLAKVTEAKEELGEKVLSASEPLAGQVKLLMTIRGITALTTSALLANVTDGACSLVHRSLGAVHQESRGRRTSARR